MSDFLSEADCLPNLNTATIAGRVIQSASQHPLPQCAMKLTVFDQRQLLDLHDLTLVHSGFYTGRRAAVGAG
jgi:hypothetical protein